jgi:hypothetical protein
VLPSSIICYIVIAIHDFALEWRTSEHAPIARYPNLVSELPCLDITGRCAEYGNGGAPGFVKSMI